MDIKHFTYKEYALTRNWIKKRYSGLVILVKKDNTVHTGLFSRTGVPDTMKYGFRFKAWK